jgi:hypothetical protein
MARRWWSLMAVGLATFMTYLDSSVTGTSNGGYAAKQ